LWKLSNKLILVGNAVFQKKFLISFKEKHSCDFDQFTAQIKNNASLEIEDDWNAYRTIKGKVLKVTYRKSDNRAQIISALWKGE